jgi:hypothetical protein
MIHIGPVKFDGTKYGLQLNRAGHSGKNTSRERKTSLQRNAPQNGRSELVLVNAGRKQVEARHVAVSAEPTRHIHPVRLPPADSAATHVEWPPAQPGAAKLVSRFLTWCFPVRGFNSPMQRILYLSMEGPRGRRHKRLTLR